VFFGNPPENDKPLIRPPTGIGETARCPYVLKMGR